MTTGHRTFWICAVMVSSLTLLGAANVPSGHRPQERDAPPTMSAVSPAGLDWRLDRWLDAEAGAPERWWRDRIGAEVEDGRVRLEILPPQGQGLNALTDRVLDALGARVIVRGTDRLDAWVSIDRIRALARSPKTGLVTLPHRPIPMVGPTVPVGVNTTLASRFHCVGQDGAGVNVAVMDANFGSFEMARTSGELPNVTDVPAGLGGSGHGTACAEIVADMAPGATIRPVRSETLAAFQYFVATLPFEDVDIISQSEMYIGLSFGNDAGPVCDAVDDAREEGVVWVTSEGNIWPGHRWLGTWKDADGDGWMEFGQGDEVLELDKPFSGSLSINLDWNDYDTNATDLDVYLDKWEVNDWAQKSSGEAINGGLVDPYEEAALPGATSGTYGISIYAKTNPVEGQALRILVLGDDKDTLEDASPSASYDPASCLYSVAVGALDPADWETGPPAPYSGHGPTTDGRTKPEVVAPAYASTMSMGTFTGTSAAAPHAAGALALVMEATGATATDAVGVLLNDAVNMGDDAPNNTYGWGRLTLSADHTVWDCEAEGQGSCVTNCGSEGSRICGDDCVWGACAPPTEQCSGQDDDCDGAIDEDFECALGVGAPCVTTCGSEGVTPCLEGCAPGTCEAPAEICDGVDQDCDEAIDEDFGCAAGDTRACETLCGSEGAQTCGASCDWGDCEPPTEACGGGDDDCDGAVDEGLSCGSADGGGCAGSAAPPSTDRVGFLLLVFGSIAFLRRRNSAL